MSSANCLQFILNPLTEFPEGTQSIDPLLIRSSPNFLELSITLTTKSLFNSSKLGSATLSFMDQRIYDGDPHRNYGFE
jgi:hypothetical protein